MAKVYKNTGDVIAAMVSDSDVLDVIAGEVLENAKRLAEPHRKTGHYIETLEVVKVPYRKGVVDRYVVATDPGALAIEYGEVTPDGKHEKGQHILGRAIGEMPEVKI